MRSNSGDDGGIEIDSEFLAAANGSRPEGRLIGSQTVVGQTENLILTGLSDEQLLNQQLYLLPASIVGFLLRQAKAGHCPPIPILRRLGLKTASELADSGTPSPISWRIAG
jgi:hypothetical protein